MKIIACLIVYNDMPFIKAVIDGLWANGVHHIIALDGAYRDFPHEKAHSTDGTWEYLVQQGANGRITRLVPSPQDGWENQEIKRTKYLREADKIAEPGDWWLQVDGDEVLIEDGADHRGWRIHDYLARVDEDRDQKARCVYVGMREVWADGSTGGYGPYAKLMRWEKGLYYGFEHWDIHDSTGRRIFPLVNDLRDPEARQWPHFKFDHHTSQRDDARLRAKTEFENFRSWFRAQPGEGTGMNPNPRAEV